MSDWNSDFHGISVCCREKWIQIKNDEALKTFLNDPKTKGSILISKYVHELYRKEIRRPIKITEDSLAIEILGHVYAGDLAKMVSSLKLKKLEPSLKDIIQRTDIIDCGELDVDPNRHIWDKLEENKNLVYLFFGKKA